MARAIGIDLGTTNSAVAAIDADGQPFLIASTEGERTTPSVVALSDSGERLVGTIARRQAATNPKNTLFSAKRLMGQRFADTSVQMAMELLPFDIVEHENGDAWVRLGQETLAPPEISAMVLQRLKADAERYFGETVTDAVITVPAYFGDGQRNATKAAGTIAGLNVLRILNEPTAAALAYGYGVGSAAPDKEGVVIVVYDLGGGTFDVSVLRLHEGVFQVTATAGYAFLGGDDLDMRIVEHLLAAFLEQTGIDLAIDPSALMRVKEAAQQAKAELSTAQRTRISLPYITSDESGPIHLQQELSRTELEDLVLDLVEQTLVPSQRAMDDAGLSVDQIDRVLLVGGQTRMPLVQAVVQDFFGQRPHQGVNPDEVVALGAAIQAGLISGEVGRPLLLLDITSQTLGTTVIGDEFSPIIPGNTSIPASMTRSYTTVSENQPVMLIDVRQGESEKASENNLLGDFHLSGLRRAPAGTVHVDVTFSVDANGILSARAFDQDTGSEAEITVTNATGLTEQQVHEMAKRAVERVEEDSKRHP